MLGLLYCYCRGYAVLISYFCTLLAVLYIFLVLFSQLLLTNLGTCLLYCVLLAALMNYFVVVCALLQLLPKCIYF